MRIGIITCLIGLMCFGAFGSELTLEWDKVAPIPVGTSGEKQAGLAGAFTGISNDAIILAGGANFPDGLPWKLNENGEKSAKTYHRDIFVLTKVTDGDSHKKVWHLTKNQLDIGWSYGASVSHPSHGVICLGGEYKTPPDDQGKQVLSRSDKVFSLVWDGKNVIVNNQFPKLPATVSGHQAVLVGDVVYVLAGDAGEGPTKHFWKLDLSVKAEARKWVELEPWAGSPRILPVVAAQNDGSGMSLYMFSGRHLYNDEMGKKKVDLLSDAWRYEIKSGRWSRLADIALKGESPRCVMAGSAIPSGVHHILIIGGADGKLFKKVEFDIPDKIRGLEASGLRNEADILDKNKMADYNSHPGFSKDILAFHTVTGTFVKIGEIQGPSPVTSSAVKWGDEIIVASGEIHPAVRTDNTLVFKLTRNTAFGTFNYIVLAIYLIAILLNGLYFSRKVKGTDDFFKAGSRIPWWAAGISIFGTQLSAMTFIAIPAKIYGTDWRILVGQFSIIIVAPFIIIFFLPFYRRLNVTTAYEYLEKRFNVFVRCFGSISFLLLQFSRIGIVLWLPSIALSVATGMDVNLCILLMGIFCIIYTSLGGMEAVIWTDVTQVVILGVGALLCLIYIAIQSPVPWNEMMEIADADHKFRLLDFRWEPGSVAFATILLGTVCQNFISYGTDQAVVQRYMTTKDEAASRKSIWTNAILAIPASFIFFLIGTALYVYYKLQPEQLAPEVSKVEAIFPLYIVENLPSGFAGLLIAAVFAASMSSLDSAMNSSSAAVTTDFYRRFKSNTSEKSCLFVARVVTIVIGILGTGFALLLAHSDIKSIWDQFAFFLGLFGGGLGGVFILGIFTKRANGLGAACGLIISGMVQFWLLEFSDINKWFFAFTGLFSCLIIGYIASLLFKNNKPIKGLTIYTINQD